MPLKKIHVSVRDMVEFVLRCGSIDSRYTGSKRAVEGTKIHQRLQKKHRKEALLKGYEYISEETLKTVLEFNSFEFEIEGRADGIVKLKDSVFIEEIKSTARNISDMEPDYNHWHFAQAKCYGYIYALINNIESIEVGVTYCEIESYDESTFSKLYTFLELKEFFYNIVGLYYEWVELSYNLTLSRNESISHFEFPYDEYRKNQKKFCTAVYKTLYSGKKLFAQAPTGTGKTVSTLFPALKYMAFSELDDCKIFYITAKTITRSVAEKTIQHMIRKGLKIKSLTLTAKDKICFTEEKICSPLKCKYANGHFDRVNDALKDLIASEYSITRSDIELYAVKHNVCPFELALDAAIFADCIICDYNYVYDPKAQLKRFFGDADKKGNYIVLVDEAHNLVERSREMYSAQIVKSEIVEAMHALHRNSPIYKPMAKINNLLTEIYNKISFNEKALVTSEYPEEFVFSLMDFIQSADAWLINNELHDSYNLILNLYFKVLDFISISDFYDSNYVTFAENSNSDLVYKLFCLNPSDLLQFFSERVYSTVFFSATFTPIEYFNEILGGSKNDNLIAVPSPFDSDKRRIIVDRSVSTRYIHRKDSYIKIAERLYIMISGKKGNYISFFPSYDYMNNVCDVFKNIYTDVDIIIQSKNMKEDDKEQFISCFDENNEKSILGFAVLGGMFSEGIDLKGEKLIGTAVIGVGLPLISPERNIIADFFNKKNNMGFAYAYIYPGMNKVMQAAGRLIRTEQDKGIIYLIDDRFLNYDYRSLFPFEWNNFIIVDSKEMLADSICSFWNVSD